MSDKTRLQFDFNQETVARLDSLKSELGFTSRVDVVKQALGLLEWATEARAQGWELIAQKGNEERVVVLPKSLGARDRLTAI